MLAIAKEIADTASNPINDFCSTIPKSTEKIIEHKAATNVAIPTKKRIRFMMFIFIDLLLMLILLSSIITQT